MRHVALLRGINVGGSNKMSMGELKTVLETAGMTSVVTYINSGNVVFSTDEADQARLTTILEDAISRHFGFSVSLLLLAVDRVRSVADAIPPSWINDESMKCDVLYLWEDVDQPSVVDRLGLDPHIEDVMYTPGAVIRRIDRANATKSRLARIMGTPLYKRMTIRNCNTARKLAELVNSQDATKPLSS
jgi:uncharacterized protein (DUF1697 family)